MARVVITGAAGFIGSHLAEAFLGRGDSVVGIDNLLTGDTANIAHLAGRDFQFVKHDVTNYIYVDGPVDFVLHWASPASPIDYLELPIPTLKVGALGTHKALGLAKAKGARFAMLLQPWSGTSLRLMMGMPSRSSSAARIVAYCTMSGTTLRSTHSLLSPRTSGTSRAWSSSGSAT